MSKEVALLTQLRKPTKQIVNYFTTGTPTGFALYATGGDMNFTETLSGALTANVLSTMLSISGSGGLVSWLQVQSKDATSRTIRIKVTVDGVVVCDVTSAAIAAAQYGLQIVGGGKASSFTSNNDIPIKFNNSFLVEVASSLTETGTIDLGYRYQLV